MMQTLASADRQPDSEPVMRISTTPGLDESLVSNHRLVRRLARDLKHGAKLNDGYDAAAVHAARIACHH
jgi:hypothetical protein